MSPEKAARRHTMNICQRQSGVKPQKARRVSTRRGRNQQNMACTASSVLKKTKTFLFRATNPSIESLSLHQITLFLFLMSVRSTERQQGLLVQIFGRLLKTELLPLELGGLLLLVLGQLGLDLADLLGLGFGLLLFQLLQLLENVPGRAAGGGRGVPQGAVLVGVDDVQLRVGALLRLLGGGDVGEVPKVGEKVVAVGGRRLGGAVVVAVRGSTAAVVEKVVVGAALVVVVLVEGAAADHAEVARAQNGLVAVGAALFLARRRRRRGERVLVLAAAAAAAAVVVVGGERVERVGLLQGVGDVSGAVAGGRVVVDGRPRVAQRVVREDGREGREVVLAVRRQLGHLFIAHLSLHRGLLLVVQRGEGH